MELNQIHEDTLDFMDELRLNCPEHKNLIVGVCGNFNCKEKQLYCMKCIKQKRSSCFNLRSSKESLTQVHNIETLSEFINNFFSKQDSKEFDLLEFNNMLEIVKNIEKEETQLKAIEYYNFSEDLYDSLLSKIKNCFDEEINKLNIEYQQELKNIESKHLDILRMPKLNLKLIQFPQMILDKSYRNFLQKYYEENSSESLMKKECQEIFSFLDTFTDINFISNELTNIENILYISKLKELEDIENKFQAKTENLENFLNLMLKEIESSLFPPKRDSLYYLKDPQNKFETNPSDLVFYKNICENAHKSNSIDCVFTCFKSFKDEYLVVWGTPNFNIDIYDLILNKITLSKIAHYSTIFSTRHYQDKKMKIDLIITSSYDKSVKVWNYTEALKIVVNISNAHTGYYIYSACLLINEQDNCTYIISSAPNEYMKLWNIQGKHLNDFGVSNQSTYFVSSWFDVKVKKYYIINANSADVKVYNFKDLSLYKTFKGTPNTWHMSAYVFEKKEKPCLVESDGTGNIRVWDFHSGNVITTVSSSGVNLRGICIWNDQYIISSGSDHSAKIYDIDGMKAVKNLTQHTSTVCSVMKIYIPKFGECLISHGLDGKLKLWANQKYIQK